MPIDFEKDYLMPGEGFLELSGAKTWYHVIGEGTAKPLILLHGGPGAPSFYLNPLSALADERPTIFFDQPGCGRSSAIADINQLSIGYFIEHLELLRQSLGISEFYLYGQSWGAVLAMEYYLKYPNRVKAIIFSSPLMNTNDWLADAAILIKTLPESIQKDISTCEASGDFSSSLYQEAVFNYYRRYVARKQPWSADIDRTFANFGSSVYSYMWGPSEFTATGILKTYDCTSKLGEINIPVLFTCGEFDEARPETVNRYHRLTPGSAFKIIEGAAHLTMQDNPEEDINTIRSFLKNVENK